MPDMGHGTIRHHGRGSATGRVVHPRGACIALVDSFQLTAMPLLIADDVQICHEYFSVRMIITEHTTGSAHPFEEQPLCVHKVAALIACA